LSDGAWLSIPEISILTKHTVKKVELFKGTHRRWYAPDYVIYSDNVPVLVVEAKSPKETAEIGFEEAQLYAHHLNGTFPHNINPASFVIATNGRDLLFGPWDTHSPTKMSVRSLVSGNAAAERLRTLFSWSALQEASGKLRERLFPTGLAYPYEKLGDNRVRLAKVGYNSLYEELDPLLRKYFDAKNAGAEDEIVEKAYVSTEETTRYERSFENFLRERVVHLDDTSGIEIATSRRSERDLTAKLEIKSMSSNRGYLQLIIGGVGAGKTTFIKRYFNFLIDPALKNRSVICRLNFNYAEALDELGRWVCESFIEQVREGYSSKIDLTTESALRSVFSVELRNNKGAYEILKKADEAAYDKRVAEDLLRWMADTRLFAKALARSIIGDRALGLIVIFDNVDRRDREDQLKIFQTAQWFMGLTQALCVITLRDETYENYKEEKPLDTYAKSGNFYIKPPRFVDMIRRRLDLAVSELSEGVELATYEIEGLGRVTYPKTRLGNYLTSVYVDLFRRKRNITMVLEGLAGKNVRRALEMFTAVLTSAHFDTREFTSSALTEGSHRIQEAILLKALMRTNYLYFMSGHGFVYNIFDFSLDSVGRGHFLKNDILDFLIVNRKKVGDVRFEGYFSVGFLVEKFRKLGYDPVDIRGELKVLLVQGLVISERLISSELELSDAVRVHASGYIHARLLTSRIDYFSAAALVTPISDQAIADKIGDAWRINDPNTDVRRVQKNIAGAAFLSYLEDRLDEREARFGATPDTTGAARMLLGRMREGLGFQARRPEVVDKGPLETEYDQLFE
jgi:hypothetical protein